MQVGTQVQGRFNGDAGSTRVMESLDLDSGRRG